MNENAKRQFFGHLFQAASHLLRAREGAAHPASPRPTATPGGGTRNTPANGATKAAPIKPLVLKRPPSCCAVKVGGGARGSE